MNLCNRKIAFVKTDKFFGNMVAELYTSNIISCSKEPAQENNSINWCCIRVCDVLTFMIDSLHHTYHTHTHTHHTYLAMHCTHAASPLSQGGNSFGFSDRDTLPNHYTV